MRCADTEKIRGAILRKYLTKVYIRTGGCACFHLECKLMQRSSGALRGVRLSSRVVSPPNGEVIHLSLPIFGHIHTLAAVSRAYRHSGFLEGAVLSGEAAAQRLLSPQKKLGSDEASKVVKSRTVRYEEFMHSNSRNKPLQGTKLGAAGCARLRTFADSRRLVSARGTVLHVQAWGGGRSPVH
jgi:hypothetical protein